MRCTVSPARWLQIHCTNPVRTNPESKPRPTRSRMNSRLLSEGNVFSFFLIQSCLSVILSVHRGGCPCVGPCIHLPKTCSNLFNLDLTKQVPAYWTCSNLFSMKHGLPESGRLALDRKVFLILANRYVSLQLLVQNRTRKWHFPLNFRILRKL